MIVYGDPSYETTVSIFSERLRARCESLPTTPSLDDWRSLLIGAGQLEQAVADSGLGGPMLAPCKAFTDGFANAFVGAWSGFMPSVPSLRLLPSGEDRLTVKVPEGFAFYGLYPEGYIVAAQRWREAVSPEGMVAVIGVRSIGTSLSAVVAETLAQASMPVHRITVRPSGHPYNREVEIHSDRLGPADWVLIVDEGPGLSGSSMASVAEAVHRAGVPRDRIVFLPGHGGEPGAHASETVRTWWASTPRCFTRTEELRWKGRTLEEVLAEATGNVLSIEDLSGGAWRGRVFADPAEWPGVAMPFERRKILVTRTDGSGVLWKFTGLQEVRSTLGFTATPWIEGQPLRREEATPELLAHIGRHIASVAGPPLGMEEAAAAAKRLEDVLYWNSLESPGPTVRFTAPDVHSLPSYGDGRLAPYEWRQIAEGTTAKVPRVASTMDHTIVGPQPIEWDIAGAMVEWGLNDESAKPLLENAPPFDPEALRFYRLAYAAFRMGQCSMCAAMADEAEASRLRRDEAFYQNTISRLV